MKHRNILIVGPDAQRAHLMYYWNTTAEDGLIQEALRDGVALQRSAITRTTEAHQDDDHSIQPHNYIVAETEW